MANKIPKKAIEKIANNQKEKISSKATESIKLDKTWAFSFESFQQRKYFGLNYKNVSKEWFISLFDRLRDLSGQKIEEVMLNSQKRDQYHFHSIAWEKSLFDKDEFFDFIPEEYRTEETDIVQFYITLSKGRVIGYFDADSIFNIVLLDPAHNMQVTRYDGYSFLKTEELPNCYLKMVNKFAAIIRKADDLEPENVQDFVYELKLILADEGYCAKSRFVTLEKNLFNDLHEILQKDPDYLSIDLIIIEAIEMFKKSLKDS